MTIKTVIECNNCKKQEILRGEEPLRIGEIMFPPKIPIGWFIVTQNSDVVAKTFHYCCIDCLVTLNSE